MDLILWRHAHAGDPFDDPVEDLNRPLSTKGERQADRMAQWLNQRLTDSTRVLCSPALRAQQTASELGRTVKLVETLAPGGSVEDLLLATRFPHSRQAVLVVGHQPTLGLVVARLLDATDPMQPWSIRKGAVWWLRWQEREGRPSIQLHAVMSPELV
jgi:phosphohistidine phosphatase